MGGKAERPEDVRHLKEKACDPHLARARYGIRGKIVGGHIVSHEFWAKEIIFYSPGVGALVRSQQETEGTYRGVTEASLQVFTLYKDMSRMRGNQ